MLKQHGIEPAPERKRQTSWSTFLNAHWDVLAAIDFTSVEVWTRSGLVNADEAKLVRRMFELFLKLESCRKVAEALNAEGILTKKYRTKTGKDFGGKPWKGRVVYDHLTDRKYIGQIVHKGKAYPGEHSAIVKTDVFEKVQAVLSANKTYSSQTPG